MKNFMKKALLKKSNAFIIEGISGIMLGALAGVFIIAAGVAIFYSARSNSNVLQFQSEIIQLSSSVSSLFNGSTTGYGDLTNEIAIKSGAVPTTLIKGNNLVNVWGGTITLTPGEDNSSFFIELTNIPDKECGRLAAGTARNQVDNLIRLSINNSVLSKDFSTAEVINLCDAGKNTLKYEIR